MWSDIPNDRMLCWDEVTGGVGVFRSPAGHPNGNTLDHLGRMITCEQGNRRVTRTEHDGSVTVLAQHYQGARLNSPNDATVRSDGTIFFSDPDCGITSDYEGYRAQSEISACNVYRIAPDTGQVALAADGFSGPNGRFVFAFDAADLSENIDHGLAVGSLINVEPEDTIEQIRRLKAIAAEGGHRLNPGHDPHVWAALTTGREGRFRER